MDEILRLASELIKIRSVSPAECKNVLKHIKNYLKPAGLVVKEFESKGFPSMVISTGKGFEFKHMLVGHIDVVPGPKELFSPKILNGRLYGRGSIDMKSQVAAMVVLIKKMARIKPSLALMLTSDEEQGGENGVKFLVNKGFKCGFFIAPDGGTNFRLITREKGVLWLEILARGKTGHGSTPWKGENAISILMEKLDKISKLFNNCEGWSDTFNIGKISGGKAPNQIPDKATAVIDIRYTGKADSILSAIGKIAEYRIIQQGSVFSTSQNHPEIERLGKVMKKVLGRNIAPGYEHGASDARFFAEKGIAGAIFNPEGGGAHSRDEYVVISSLDKFYRILEIFAAGK